MTGTCQCGCGQRTRLAPVTRRSRGWTKGEPIRFVHGHSGNHDSKSPVAFVVDQETGCWEWRRAKNSAGYGHGQFDGRRQLAHRAFYERFVGPIPEGLVLDHLCRNRACVNPGHLEAVTHRTNILRGDGVAARWARGEVTLGVRREALPFRLPMPVQAMHLQDLWDKPEAARKGNDIAHLIEHPGWDALMEALEGRNRAEQVQLMRGKATGEGATYERIIGQWAGRESIKDIAEGAVEAGRKAEEEMNG